MATFTDFYENRILEITTAQGSYSLPYTLSLVGYVDTDTLTVTINGQSVSVTPGAAVTELVALQTLQTDLNALGEPVTISILTDDAGQIYLSIAQNAPYQTLTVTSETSGVSSWQTTRSLYLALFTSDPTETGIAGQEVSETPYERQRLTFGAVASGSVSTLLEAEFSAVGSNSWGTVTHVGLYDLFEGGNLLMYAPLIQGRTLLTGDVMKFGIGDIEVTLD